jgi:hypothetical protein
MRLLEKRGLDSGGDPLARDDPLLATLMAASVRSRIATGPEAGQPWLRLGDRVDPVEPREGGNDANAEAPARCVRQGGMSLHADVSVPARDRRRLERLCRYILRPPLALARLEALRDGRLTYRLKTRWRDGTTHVLMERHELLERLAPYSEAVASSSHRRGLTRPGTTASWRSAPAEGIGWCRRRDRPAHRAQLRREGRGSWELRLRKTGRRRASSSRPKPGRRRGSERWRERPLPAPSANATHRKAPSRIGYPGLPSRSGRSPHHLLGGRVFHGRTC